MMGSSNPNESFTSLLNSSLTYPTPPPENSFPVLKVEGGFNWLEDISTPRPTISKPDDVLIRVNATAISGCDIHFWKYGFPKKPTLKDYMVPGHESAGTVIAIGSAVTTLKPGDRVALEPILPCRSCRFCDAKTYHLCRQIMYAATPLRNGTLSKHYVLPEDLCAILPPNVSLHEGALVEILAIALHAVREGRVSSETSLVIFGAAPIGLLCCAVARILDTRSIIVIDHIPERLVLAEKKYGATEVFNPGDATPSGIAEHFREGLLGDGADVVIDTGGFRDSDETAIHLLRHGGIYVLPGMWLERKHKPTTTLDGKVIRVLKCLRYATGDYKDAINLLRNDLIDVKELIGPKFKFENAEEAFLAQAQWHSKKVLIEGPQGE